MSEWKECKLGDVVTFQRGFDITQNEQSVGDFPVVSSSGTKSYHKEYKVKGPGVVIGRKGTLGTVFYLKGNYWPHDTTLWVKDFHDNYPYFVYYYLKKFEFGQFDVGSSNPTLNRNHIHLLPAFIPPLSEQQAIASILSSLDDKIDLLHRQNNTLEAMAETLFRQWVVEEAQEGWEEKTLSSIAEHKKINVIPDQNHGIFYCHYSIPAFDDGKHPIRELGSEIKSNKYQVVANSILISKLNPKIPRVWAIVELLDDNSICSTEFQVVYPTNSEYYYFIYCLLKSRQVTDELIGAAGGTSGSHQRVRPEDIFNFTFQMPPLPKLGDFNLITATNWKKIKVNSSCKRTT